MKAKEGVKLSDLEFVMREVLMHADETWEAYNQELVVTSTAESVHSASSLHYYGLAVDFRTHYFNDVDKQKVYKELIKRLGDKFTVILEPTHIHVQLNLQAQQQQR